MKLDVAEPEAAANAWRCGDGGNGQVERLWRAVAGWRAQQDFPRKC
jgi:hypothetical protein